MIQAKLLFVIAMMPIACYGSDSGQVMLGTVNKNLSENGGCAVTTSDDVWNALPIFTSNYQNQATINIKGSDILLTLVKMRDPSSDRIARIGQRSIYWYRDNNLSLRIEYIVTWVCPPNYESCEVFQARAKLKLNMSGHVQTIVGHALCGT